MKEIPSGIKTISILDFLIGIIIIFNALFYVTRGISQYISIYLLILFSGLIIFILGIYLRKAKQWARIGQIAITGLYFLIAAFFLIKGLSTPDTPPFALVFGLPVLVLSLSITWYLISSKKTKEFFNN